MTDLGPPNFEPNDMLKGSLPLGIASHASLAERAQRAIRACFLQLRPIGRAVLPRWVRQHLVRRLERYLGPHGQAALPRQTRAPKGPAGGTQLRALSIDEVLNIDDHSVYVWGWMHDCLSELVSLVAISPAGESFELTDRLIRYPRPDVEQYLGLTSTEAPVCLFGFAVFVQTAEPNPVDRPWEFRMLNEQGNTVKATAMPLHRDPIDIRSAVLEHLPDDGPASSEQCLHFLPAVGRLQRSLDRLVKIASVVQFGDPHPAENPEVSIVVPLFQRLDLMEHQLAQFADDPEVGRSDLIYVLDSPELASDAYRLAPHLADLYGVPFRLVVLSRNGGVAIATNRAASLARGRLLLLMDSDVIPAEPGWLGHLAAFYDATPGIGALGPKLLYEDGSLQHAGVYFQRFSPIGPWENRHYFKGLHRDLPAANVTRSVPAVTGACLLLSRKAFEDVGGLRYEYVQIDYEDSDLCLRLNACGRTNWYLPTVELYHLEAQSYPSEARPYRRYNAWLQTLDCHAQIAESMAKAGSDRPGVPRPHLESGK
jgi:GT2 family glycosyltransferase